MINVITAIGNFFKQNQYAYFFQKKASYLCVSNKSKLAIIVQCQIENLIKQMIIYFFLVTLLKIIYIQHIKV